MIDETLSFPGGVMRLFPNPQQIFSWQPITAKGTLENQMHPTFIS
jgi:hypothetical protein